MYAEGKKPSLGSKKTVRSIVPGRIALPWRYFIIVWGFPSVAKAWFTDSFCSGIYQLFIPPNKFLNFRLWQLWAELVWGIRVQNWRDFQVGIFPVSAAYWFIGLTFKKSWNPRLSREFFGLFKFDRNWTTTDDAYGWKRQHFPNR
jgi:hypothetical protein